MISLRIGRQCFTNAWRIWAKALGEKAKVAVRNIRKESNDKIKKLEKDKEITEDESKKAHDEVQKITDTYVDKVDSLVKDKEAELMKV